MRVSAAKQTPALGSAMFGAVAAGKAAGGYDSIFDASLKMAHLRDVVYQPIPANQAVYERLFQEYLALHDYFGRGANDVMKRLKALKAEVILKQIRFSTIIQAGSDATDPPHRCRRRPVPFIL